VFWRCSEVADQGVVGTQKQRFAIFGTRAPVSATPVVYPHRNQIFLGGQRRAGQLPRLHPTSQQSVQTIMQKTYVHRPPLVYCLPFQRYACFLVSEPSKWPSCIRIDVPWRQGNDGGAMAGYVGKTGCSRRSRSKLFEALLAISANSVSEFPSTYDGEVIDEDSVSGGKDCFNFIHRCSFFTKNKPYYTAPPEMILGNRPPCVP
jgi:hypothetical protein